MRNREIQLTLDIGTTEISILVEYDYTKGAPERGPSYSSGGEPAEPPEVNINSIHWAPVTLAGTQSRQVGEFKELEPGTFFDLIAQDQWVYEKICDNEDNDYDYE